MSITIKSSGTELQDLEQECRAMLDLQMPSLIRGDEDAAEFFSSVPTTSEFN